MIATAKIIEATSEGVVTVDAKGKISCAKTRCLKMLETEVLGRTIFELMDALIQQFAAKPARRRRSR